MSLTFWGLIVLCRYPHTLFEAYCTFRDVPRHAYSRWILDYTQKGQR